MNNHESLLYFIHTKIQAIKSLSLGAQAARLQNDIRHFLLHPLIGYKWFVKNMCHKDQEYLPRSA